MTATMKKYADVVRAYLDGADVQLRPVRAHPNFPHVWEDTSNPHWNCGYEYRIKPKEPRIVEQFIRIGTRQSKYGEIAHHVEGVYLKPSSETFYASCTGNAFTPIANIKLCCNEETGEVLSVELIKETK